MNRNSSNIVSSEMMTNISGSQMRMAPVLRQSMVLVSVAFMLWFFAMTSAATGLEKSRWATGNANLIAVFLCLGGLSLLNSVRLWRKYMTTPVFNNYTRFVFVILLFWCTITIVRADWLNKWEFKQILGTRYFGWAWVVPMSMVLGSDIRIWKRALKVVVSMGVLGCVIFVIGWVLLGLRGDFGFTRICPLAMLFWHYFPKRTKRFLFIASFIGILLSVLSATRNAVFGASILLLSAGYIQFFRRDIWRFRTRVCLIFVFSVVFVMSIYVASVDYIPFAGNTINVGISRFKEKFYDNSRTNIDGDWLYTELLQDVRGFDFVFGRGCRGTYNANLGSVDDPFQSHRRNYIECGYFQIILHGGVVMLILILSLAAPAIYLGMFRSRNWFTRGCAFIVLGRLFEMVPFGLPVADVRYVLFWMAIGTCLTWRIRAMSDAEIVKIFNAGCALDAGSKK